MYARILPFLFGVIFSASTVCQAQQASPNGVTANLADCVRVIKGDSVSMYYTASYVLTPVACATLRRDARIDGNGDFSGIVRDYRMSDNKLCLRLSYSNGRRQGIYEQYHNNGQLALRGEFAKGEPTGIWRYWYPNGKPRQEFEWVGEQPELHIKSYWDSTGQQLLTQGSGVWFDTQPNLPRKYGGPVVEGLAHGLWESRDLKSNQLCNTERYEHGKFKEGRAFGASSSRYKGSALLMPQLPFAAAAAESPSITASCAALAQQRQLQALRSQVQLVPPRPLGDVALYQQRFLTSLQAQLRQMQWLQAMEGRQSTVIGELDADGHFISFACSEDATLASAVDQVMRQMSGWQSATANGQSVPGTVRFELMVHSSVVSIRMHTYAKQPLPAAIFERTP